MVIKLSCWNVAKTKAHTLRGCTRCAAQGLSFQERRFQEPREVAERATAAARRSRRARSLAHHDSGPIFLGAEIGAPWRSGNLIFVGRLCKTCVLSGYKMLGSEPDWTARQSLKKFLAFDSQ